MKSSCFYLILLLIVFCLLIPAGVAAPTASIVSAPADTSGTPPQAATAYINETMAAEADLNWTSALVITTHGLAWYPDNAELLCLQAYSYRKMGYYQQAVDDVSRAILVDPRPVRFANRGYAYLAQKNYTAALADADSGIALNATYPVSYSVKALALQSLGRNTEALAAINTAVSLAPDSAHYWHVKGRILAARGDCTGAADALEKSLEINPDYVLPYPGFGSAAGGLAALKTVCVPASAATPVAKSPLGCMAVAGVIGAVVATGRKQ
jgi:tetratricopeptide (TPR) repeat protein